MPIRVCRPDYCRARAKPSSLRSIAMLDVILVAAALAFFALSVGYTIACDRL